MLGRRFSLGLILVITSACGGKSAVNGDVSGSGGMSDAGGASGSSGAHSGGSAGSPIAGNGGSAGSGPCGGVTCSADQICCGPAECGHCIPKFSGQNCPTFCSGSGGASGAAGSSGAGGSAGAGDACATCGNRGLSCCGEACRNFANDPKNCGACGNACPASASLCESGQCVAPTCTAELCAPDSVCCGSSCCGSGQLCCQPSGGGIRSDGSGECTDPVDGTCPVGCPLCICASPDTPIATPSGELPIASLKVGDLIYSQGARGVVVVPVLQINRARVSHHTMVRLTLANGATLELSPRHPTADGRQIGDLVAGERIDGVSILTVERVPYREPFTYDILADSASGAYFAGGVLIGSTLREQVRSTEPVQPQLGDRFK